MALCVVPRLTKLKLSTRATAYAATLSGEGAGSGGPQSALAIQGMRMATMTATTGPQCSTVSCRIVALLTCAPPQPADVGVGALTDHRSAPTRATPSGCPLSLMPYSIYPRLDRLPPARVQAFSRSYPIGPDANE